MILRLAVIVQPMRKSLLLPGFRLAPGRPRLRLCREGTVLVESVADLLDREPRAGLADHHRVEVGVVSVLVGQDGLAGGCQHLGSLAPFVPCVEAGNGDCSLACVALKHPVRLDMTFGRGQIALGY
ncbi:MAG: hypothetical protein OXF79_25990, partial [Chloroflexi bacterium]|nr:hypothetical protein [Chloroflexota bacterium]